MGTPYVHVQVLCEWTEATAGARARDGEDSGEELTMRESSQDRRIIFHASKRNLHEEVEQEGKRHA